MCLQRAVYSTDGQTDIFQTEKQRQKGTDGRTATNPCRRRRQRQRQRQRRARLSRRRNRTDHSPVPTALAGSNSLFYKPSQPYNVPSNKLCFCCHGAEAFSLQLFPCDIFGEVNYARVQNRAVGGLVVSQSLIFALTLIDIQWILNSEVMKIRGETQQDQRGHGLVLQVATSAFLGNFKY